MRIAAGGLLHETSSYSVQPTRLRDFETGFGLYRGQEIVDRFAGANMCIGGFIDGARREGFELVPLLWGFAYPSGLIDAGDYAALKAEFLQRLKDAEAQGPIDGVLLDLHGAMVVDGIDDGDGDFIASAREVVANDRSWSRKICTAITRCAGASGRRHLRLRHLPARRYERAGPGMRG